MPISLARGHVQTEFDINVESYYEVELRLSSEREHERPLCPDGAYCDVIALQGTNWSVTNGNETVARGQGRPDGFIPGRKGHYVFGLDVPEDQSWLNFYEPRIVIYESGGRAHGGFRRR